MGDNYPRGMQADFVLGKWLKSEEPLVLLKIEKCIELIESYVHAGLGPTMTAFNNLVFAVG